MNWNYLTEEQQYEARELAVAYRRERPRTLPTYGWIKEHSDTVAKMPHNTFIAFSRAILDACKAVR